MAAPVVFTYIHMICAVGILVTNDTNLPGTEMVRWPWQPPPPAPPPPPPSDFLSTVFHFTAPTLVNDLVSDPDVEFTLGGIIITVLGVAVALLLRRVAQRSATRALNRSRERVLNMSALNTVNATKEVVWGYVNAGMLEPLISIAGSEEISSKELVVNLFQLVGLFMWVHLIYDAFDTSDVQQNFAYRHMDPSGTPWLRRSAQNSSLHSGNPRVSMVERKAHQQELVGQWTRDLALWFMLLGPLLAFAGVVNHREVVHSYAIVLLWIILHHQSRAATSWGAGYMVTLFMPSAALMPLEYCLTLADAEKVESIEALDEWRAYIADAVGIELTIEA